MEEAQTVISSTTSSRTGNQSNDSEQREKFKKVWNVKRCRNNTKIGKLIMKKRLIIGVEVHGSETYDYVTNSVDASDLTLNEGDTAFLYLSRFIDIDDTTEENDSISSSSDSSQSALLGNFRTFVSKRGTFFNSSQGISNIRLRTIRIDDVTFKKRKNDICTLYFYIRDQKKKEKFIFESSREAKEFKLVFDNLKQALDERCSLALDRFSSEPEMRYLFEIVAAYDVRIANKGKQLSDPYCVVRVGCKPIHRTKAIKNTLQPVWTISSESLFILNETKENIIRHRLTFELYDWEAVMTETSLGRVHVSFSTILQFIGERKEFCLEDTDKYKQRGCLVLRWREATEYDEKFIFDPKGCFRGDMETKKLIDPAKYCAPRVQLLGKGSSKILNGKIKKMPALVRNQSFPQVLPQRIPLLCYANSITSDESEVVRESLQPSRSWIESGSGDLGQVFIEIIKCDGLPERISSFLTVVFEDAGVSTSVIEDTDNPKFMPWTRRAFVFNIAQVSSELYIAVFEYNVSTNHTFIGRITINLARYRSNTEYLLDYTLYESARIYPRKSAGTITLRMSIEWKNQRETICNVFKGSHQFRINVDKSKDYRMFKRTVEGRTCLNTYSMSSIESYLDELMYYINIFFLDLPLAVTSVLFWRSTQKINITNELSVSLPIWSILLFLSGILVVEIPTLIPSVVMALIGSIMLYLGTQHESPWSHPRSFGEMLLTLLTGKAQPLSMRAQSAECQVPENETKYMPHLERFQHRNEEEAELDVLWAEEWELEGLTTEHDNVLHPIKKLLWPLQITLSILCGQIRFFYRILVWRRFIFAFWLTSISFALSFLFLFLPWSFLYRSCGRMFVWCFLSPFMKLVDILYMKEKSAAGLSNLVREERLRVRKIKEQATKLEAMKVKLFGKHIVSMPSEWLPERYEDVPLLSSSAVPLSSEELKSKCINNPKRLCGQRLNVDMIAHSVHQKQKSLRGPCHGALRARSRGNTNSKVFPQV